MILISQQCKLFLKVILVVFICRIKAENRGFILTVSNTLRVNTSENVCVSFHNIMERGKITVNLTSEQSIIASSSAGIFQGRSTCLILEIPNTRITHGDIKVEVNFPSLKKTLQSKAKVTIVRDSVMTFIETDKNVYKYGQKVLFRIFRLTNKLLPVTTPISEVWIENPSGVRLAQWREPKIDNGLTDLSFELSNEPSLGEWSICLESMYGNKEKQSFHVKEYVLPTFEVIITTTPNVLLVDFEIVTLRVCAHYTFGQPVNGKLNVEAKGHMLYEMSVYFSTNSSIDLVRGCHEMTIFKSNFTSKEGDNNAKFFEEIFDDFTFNPVDQIWTSITYFAEVIEKGTEVKIESTKSQKIFHQLLQFEFRSKKYFKPNMTYFGKISVQFRDGNPAINKSVTLKVDSNRKRIFTEKHISNNLGEVDFVFLPTTSHAHFISLQQSDGSRRSSINETLKSWYSPSLSFLQITPISFQNVDCAGDTFKISVNFTLAENKINKMITFYYQVLARGRLVIQHKKQFNYQNEMWDNWTRSHGLITGNFELEINLISQISPIANIVVFCATNNGEIVSDSQEIVMEMCFGNKVNLAFHKDVISPATTSAITITAQPLSLCALSVVDKSTRLLSSTDFLSIEKVYASISKKYPKSVTPSNVKTNCSQQSEDDDDDDDDDDDTSLYAKSDSAFNEVGLITISNFHFETLLCASKPRHKSRKNEMDADIVTQSGTVPASLSKPTSNKEPFEVTKSAVSIRDYFPETWLWELQRTNKDGVIRLERQIPHSITTWIGTVFCLSNIKGLGVSKQVSVRGFQAFFMSFTMPFSIKNEEVAPVTVTIFNYISECIPVRIRLSKSGKYTLVNSNESHETCLCDVPYTHKFWIRPSNIGNIVVTVYAKSVPTKKEICNSESKVSNVNASDAASHNILVKAQGFPREYSNTTWICQQGQPTEYFYRRFYLELPNDVIQNSGRAFVSITGDLMGPTVQGLDNLVKLPVGCGEQNMVLFAPNIYVLQYLMNSKQLTHDLEEKVIEHLKTGYQRQLNYKHDDGSFSAFGKWDSIGSIWLTAFVLKSFAQAKPFVYIDLQDLKNSEEFIFKNQLPNGSFLTTGRVLSKAMQGGIASETSDQSLAAYILIALLEAGSESNSTRVNQTLEYLSSNNYMKDNTYLLAMKAYAATLAKRNDLASLYINQLKQRATRKGDMLYWTEGNIHGSLAMNIEITSYALLTLVTQNAESNKMDALSIVRWLTNQRNAYGGFVSTQDTILALQAIAKYAGLAHSGNVELRIRLNAAKLRNVRITVNNLNKLVQQTKEIPVLPTFLGVTVTGEGCVMVQYTMKYNVFYNRPTDAFTLDVTVNPVSKNCSEKQLEICTSYKLADGHSNMAVIEVQMISGFEADTNTLNVLQNSVEVQLKRWEFSPEGYINLYFDELTSMKKCFNFKVKQKFEVLQSKPAIVKVFDYYEPEHTISTTYSFSSKDICREI